MGIGDTIRLGDTAGGTDYIFGGPGNNQITMGDGNAYIIGASGQIEYYAGSDVVETVQSTDPGTGGSDAIQAGSGDHTIIGDNGSSSITAGNGDNIIVGDNGTIDYCSTGLLASIVTTSPAAGANNTITAGNGDNIIFGGAGENTITTGAGNQIVFGHNGEIDYQSSGALSSLETTDTTADGADTITLGDTAGGTDYILGGPADNQIAMGNGNAYIIGAGGQIEFYSGSSYIETVQSTDPYTGLSNTITALDGDHTIIGGDGSNRSMSATATTLSSATTGQCNTTPRAFSPRSSRQALPPARTTR